MCFNYRINSEPFTPGPGSPVDSENGTVKKPLPYNGMILFLDGLAGFFLVGMGILGFRRGLVEEMGRLLGLIIAITIAMRYYVDLTGYLLRWLDIDAWVSIFLSYALLFSAGLLMVRFITILVHYLIVTRGTKWMNHSMGFLFGIFKGSVVVAMVVWLIDLSPMDRWSEIMHSKSNMVHNISKTRDNIIGMFGWEDPVERGERFIKGIMNNRESEQKVIE